jgi:DNA-binding PadR family transcriptional regulator
MMAPMSLRHVLLGLLVDRTASGYDLLKLFNTSLANVWPATQSQVYGELSHLTDAGLLEVAAEGPRGRKAYALTVAGMTELRRWMTETPVGTPLRDADRLRVFFLQVLPPAQAREYLERLADHAAEQHAALQELKASRGWSQGKMLTTDGRLALEYGLRLTETQEQWARWAAEERSTPADRA